MKSLILGIIIGVTVLVIPFLLIVLSYTVYPHFYIESSDAKIIAQKIISYNETQIKDYPISDLSSVELKAVFAILNPGNLSKIFINISVEELNNIKNKLSIEEFENILNMLPNKANNIIKEYINWNKSYTKLYNN